MMAIKLNMLEILQYGLYFQIHFCFILYHALNQPTLSTVDTNADHPVDMVKGIQIKLYYIVLGETRYYKERKNCT